MKNRNALFFFLATLLCMTSLMVNIRLVRAIGWSVEEPLITDPLQDCGPAIMQAGDGTIWVVWSSNRMGYSNYELFYRTSLDYGLNWSNDARLTEDLFGNESDDTSPSIMQASNGTIWVVWSSFRTGHYELFYKTFNGTAWSADTQLPTGDGGSNIDPSIAQARDGTIWVVWTSDRNGNDDLFYKTYNGVSWSADTQLNSPHSDPDNFPSIMQTSSGQIWVVWSSYIKTIEDFELFYKTFDGTAWSADTRLTYNSALDTAPSIAQARDGTIWVVWQSGDIAELYYKTYNSSAWSSDIPLTNHGASDIAPSIAQIDDRKVWVVWAANRDKDFDIYYKTSTEIFNVSDFILLAQHYGLTPSSPDWDPNADLNKDNIVNVFDVWLLGKKYG